MSEIKKNKFISDYPRLDFQVIEVGLGNEKQFIDQTMNGPNADLFKYIEPDYIESPSMDTNDPKLADSWQHVNMQNAMAWNTTTGSPDVTVAICDTGIQMNPEHPDLIDNRLEGYNAVDEMWESAGGVISAVTSHGTECAGCAASIGNNGVGGVGVGWNFKFRAMQVSTLALGGSAYSSDIAHCAQVSCDQLDVKAVSVSFAGVEQSLRKNAATYCKSMGSLMFNSAGNDGRNITGYDADADDLIVVGATDQNDALQASSAYGSYVDLYAPGASVYTTSLASAYAFVSGTSFSSPLAAGLAALIWSANPNLTPDEVELVMKESVDPFGFGGRINSYNAMQHSLVAGTITSSTTTSTTATNPPPSSTSATNSITSTVLSTTVPPTTTTCVGRGESCTVGNGDCCDGLTCKAHPVHGAQCKK